MAQIKKDGNSMGLPMNINRGNPIPVDSTEVWYSFDDAQTYAQSGATAYVGQVLSVVDETANSTTLYLISNTAGDLVEVGSGGSGGAMIIVSTVAGLTTLGEPPTGVPNDLVLGTTAYCSEDRKMHILTSVGSNAPTSYKWEVQASDAPEWGEL